MKGKVKAQSCLFTEGVLNTPLSSTTYNSVLLIEPHVHDQGEWVEDEK